jgi:hypothetical protein
MFRSCEVILGGNAVGYVLWSADLRVGADVRHWR